ACERFRESQRLQPAGGTALNLAICEEQLGQLVEAWQHYHAALDALPERDGRREIARQGLLKLDPRLARFVIRKAVATPPDMRVRLGQVVIHESSFGVAIPVTPGEQRWLVTAPGYGTRAYSRKVAAGESFTLTVTPGAPNAKRVLPRSQTPSRAPLLGYALIGVGAASLVVSGVTALMALDRGRTVDSECSGRDCTADGLRAADQGETLVRWCTLSFVFGLLGAGSGTYLVLDGNDSNGARASSKSARLRLP
ncbi:MAG TPA: hypothetical protein VK524_18120, partial [Polyangiaceae bacterium]|nr:hypothetical protein [Polyangiaceae bacterium]